MKTGHEFHVIRQILELSPNCQKSSTSIYQWKTLFMILYMQKINSWYWPIDTKKVFIYVLDSKDLVNPQQVGHAALSLSSGFSTECRVSDWMPLWINIWMWICWWAHMRHETFDPSSMDLKNSVSVLKWRVMLLIMVFLFIWVSLMISTQKGSNWSTQDISFGLCLFNCHLLSQFIHLSFLFGWIDLLFEPWIWWT